MKAVKARDLLDAYTNETEIICPTCGLQCKILRLDPAYPSLDNVLNITGRVHHTRIDASPHDVTFEVEVR